ncbi:MAG: electron transport complex subunit RsxC [Gammaproteobacteria bacterium]|nr:electron transport complex subunit RsxC [Gammaproteobacteria bacterium]
MFQNWKPSVSIKLHRFNGGVQLDDHKAGSVSAGLQQASLPRQLILPLKQHIGEPNKALVRVGDRVLRGQLIADSSSSISAPIHAPSSGIIHDISPQPVPHPSAQADDCIVIDVDGKDEAVAVDPVVIDDLSSSQLIHYIRHAGVVGLGGAVFPNSAKLLRGNDTGIQTLIINGAECEPYISCDDMLMRHYADEIITGIGYLQRILTPLNTIIAIEDNKPEAMASIQQALAAGSLKHAQVVTIPTIYPSGGEKQLIEILTGREVPSGKLAFDIGLFCQNVGTCAAICQALEQSQPLTSRIVTISGDGILQPGNWETRLGTPISHLINLAGGYSNTQKSPPQLIMGGPMMGFPLSSDQIPVVKATNSILLMQQQTLPQPSAYHDECVRCGRCAEVCPIRLLPQQLYWHARAKNYERCTEYHLPDCIECGCCAVVCPSRIPLVQYYRAAKSDIRTAKKAQFKSDRARDRFEARAKRLVEKKQQEEERRRLRREALKQTNQTGAGKPAMSDPVKAALERVKAKKQARASGQ